jgi:hypothetical protein
MKIIAAIALAYLLILCGCYQKTSEPDSNSIGWVNIATIPSNDRQLKETISRILNNEKIEHGFHGSRVHALCVHPLDELKARNLIKSEILKNEHARMWSPRNDRK